MREFKPPDLKEAAPIVRLLLNDVSVVVMTDARMEQLFNLAVGLWPNCPTEQIACRVAALWAASRGNTDLANFYLFLK